MKLLAISDIHIEYMKDAGLAFYKRLHQTQADVCVVAGDLIPLCDLRYVEVTQLALWALTKHFPHVLYILGNHEYYGGSREQMIYVCKALEERFDNLYILQRETITLDGVKFAGSTLWFPNQEGNEFHYRNMDDFRLIYRLPYWVYDENAADTQFFGASDADVWLMHHLPSKRSVPKFFKNSPLNRFFVSDLTAQIAKQKPKLVIHGHSHSSSDYQLGTTRVYANPHGAKPKNRQFTYETVEVEV